ncbi:MAG: hypothetical protein ACRDY0_03440 [Acidimicrobiales bacterium]
MYQLARDMDERRVQQMGIEARDSVMDDQRFIERLKDNERLRDLLVQAAEAARRTAWQAKRVVLGRVVGQAVVDDAQVDESAALVAALASLEPPHVRYLTLIAGGQWREGAPVPDGARPAEPVPEPYRAALIAHGLVDANTYDGVIGSDTPFGHRLLGWLRDAEPGGPPSAAATH